MTKFDDDTALATISPGVYEGVVSPDWRIVVGANGGHIAAILLRGMVLAVADDQRTPRALNVHFVRPPKEAAVQVRVVVEREGRTMSNVSARMVQDDKLVALGMAAFSEPRSGPDFSDLRMPEVPPPEKLEPDGSQPETVRIARVADRIDFPFGHHFDILRALGPLEGERSERAEIGVWMRLREPQVADHLVATQLLDAYAPAVFAKLGVGGGGSGVPTVEMTYHYREALPLTSAGPDDWYLGVYRTMTSSGGFIEEDGWLWHRSGSLVAQSRQLALLQT
jgi:acyl-CoA thioesterase